MTTPLLGLIVGLCSVLTGFFLLFCGEIDDRLPSICAIAFGVTAMLLALFVCRFR